MPNNTKSTNTWLDSISTDTTNDAVAFVSVWRESRACSPIQLVKDAE